MCGRFSNAQSIPQYRSAVRDQLPEHREPTPAPDADDYVPSHNVAPQTRSPVIRRELSWERERRLKHVPNPTREQKELQLILQTMKWGLIPRYHKTPPSYGETYRTINARDDTILSPQRSMWHPLLPAQRCVVFVQGFYEWQKKGSDSERVERIPHFVGMSEPGHGRADKDGKEKRLMPLAGLYERVRFEGEDKPLYTFTIVTTCSNDQLGFLHDRMPVILPTAEAIGTWLGLGMEGKGSNPDDTWSVEVAKLLKPLKGELECYKVPKEVGKVGNNDASFILPVEERKDGLKAFFAKQSTKPAQGERSNQQQHRQGNPTEKEVQKDDAEERDVEIESVSSFENTQALMAAQEVEDDVVLAEAAAKLEQEARDRRLAEQVQKELDNEEGQGTTDQQRQEILRSQSIVDLGETDDGEDRGQNRAVEAEEVGDGFGVPKGEAVEDDIESVSSSPAPSVSSRKRKDDGREEEGGNTSTRFSKRLRTGLFSADPGFFTNSGGGDGDGEGRKEANFNSTREGGVDNEDADADVDEVAPRTPPSSRFSPDPFNPPLSPPRPKGGYSRRLSPASGGGIHVNPKRGKKGGSKPHEPFPQAPPHTWKKSQPAPQNNGPTIENLLAHQRQVASHQQQHETHHRNNTNEKNGATHPDSPTKPAKALAQKSSISPTKTTKPTDAGRGRTRTRTKSNDSAATTGSADIRTFFSPSKKSS